MDGNFYGTTTFGGTISGGTVFKITPSGTFAVIHNFTKGTDGGFPRNPPVPAPDGKLYGTSGTGTNSTAYSITPAGVLTPLKVLGVECIGPLTLGNDGRFYGITNVGGAFNRGSVFAITMMGVLKTIFSFNDAIVEI